MNRCENCKYCFVNCEVWKHPLRNDYYCTCPELLQGAKSPLSKRFDAWNVPCADHNTDGNCKFFQKKEKWWKIWK